MTTPDHYINPWGRTVRLPAGPIRETAPTPTPTKDRAGMVRAKIGNAAIGEGWAWIPVATITETTRPAPTSSARLITETTRPAPTSSARLITETNTITIRENR